MRKALVVLSGGMDSAVCLALAKRDNKYVEAITFDYGQRHAKEMEYAADLCSEYDTELHRWELDIPDRHSSLTSSKPVPQMSYEEMEKQEGPSSTYVHFRNGMFLSTATSFALEIEANVVYAGMHAEDALNWAYPDCTPEFLGAMANAIYVGTYHKVRLLCPLEHMTKAEVVQSGNRLRVPFEITWSCYEGYAYHCGVCPTCQARMGAFMTAGADDPTEYREIPDA